MTQPVLTKYKQGDLPQDYVKKADRMKTINLDAEADRFLQWLMKKITRR